MKCIFDLALSISAYYRLYDQNDVITPYMKFPEYEKRIIRKFRRSNIFHNAYLDHIKTKQLIPSEEILSYLKDRKNINNIIINHQTHSKARKILNLLRVFSNTKAWYGALIVILNLSYFHFSSIQIIHFIKKLIIKNKMDLTVHAQFLHSRKGKQFRMRDSKRLFDLAVAVSSVIILSPFLVLVGFLVRLKIGSPVLFRQVRPGLHGRPFVIYKFRSMTDERDENGNLLSDGDRLTRFGRFLRKTSMDELPEFFNVIKGDISIVGPRPLLMQYLDRYTPEQARRHEVKPGITGWAQVNGRNAISWDDKFELDVWYVDNLSLWLDIKIILMTVVKVLRRDGISQDGHATAQEFLGSHAKAQRRKDAKI